MKSFFWIAIALLLPIPALAGVVSDDLAAQAAVMTDNELVDVWIELEDPPEARAARLSTQGLPVDRADRYRQVLQRLWDARAGSQDVVTTHLLHMAADARVSSFSGHWLVNVVEATVSVEALDELASVANVKAIHPAPKITLIRPDARIDVSSKAAGVTGATDRLRFINADDAWAAGYTGAGRLVCSFDTGVEGDHPALEDSWRGNDGDHAAAWFDQHMDASTTPIVIEDCGFENLTLCNEDHGTHTCGTMVGHDDATGDTVGVAPGAEWISAAVIDVMGTSIIDAFEWAANPDGDPNTVYDVPDVINHSWGVTGLGCQDIFFDLIDATEALGIVNIFAAGNDGSENDVLAAETIRNPANRALDSLDCFAVGNLLVVSQDSVRHYSTSSRGPSDCNGAIKPNVMAPGDSVYSSIPGGDYQIWTGTSMAAPHVSGLVALLRQKNPNATVDEIKEAILTTCRDFDHTLPNNKLGWGVIDCMAALNALSGTNTEPSLRIWRFAGTDMEPGDTVSSSLALQNLGSSAYNVSATIIGSDPSLTVIEGSVSLGTIAANDTAVSASNLSVAVSDTVTPGRTLALDLRLAANGYADTVQLYFPIQPAVARTLVTHNTGRIEFSLSNFGTFGLGDESFFDLDYSGFRFDGGLNYLYEGGFILASDITQISDGLRNLIGEPDGDFRVMPGNSFVIEQPGEIATQETSCRFSDDRAEDPIGIEVEQRSYAWTASPDNDFIILRYVLENVGVSPVSVFAGIYLDWDPVNWGANAGGFESDDSLLWIAYNSGGNKSNHRGLRHLAGPLATAHTGAASITYFESTTNPTGDGFTEEEKYGIVIDGLGSAATHAESATDLMQCMAMGPLTLSPGEADTVAFAIVAGTDYESADDAGEAAAALYRDSIATDVQVHTHSDGSLPEQFVLYQNYPNPFNPTTTISFDLPTRSEYRLVIYNLLGQEVLKINGESSAGQVDIEWKAARQASGVYFYRLDAAGQTATRKMLLLK